MNVARLEKTFPCSRNGGRSNESPADPLSTSEVTTGKGEEFFRSKKRQRFFRRHQAERRRNDRFVAFRSVDDFFQEKQFRSTDNVRHSPVDRIRWRRRLNEAIVTDDKGDLKRHSSLRQINERQMNSRFGIL